MSSKNILVLGDQNAGVGEVVQAIGPREGYVFHDPYAKMREDGTCVTAKHDLSKERREPVVPVMTEAYQAGSGAEPPPKP